MKFSFLQLYKEAKSENLIFFFEDLVLKIILNF